MALCLGACLSAVVGCSSDSDSSTETSAGERYTPPPGSPPMVLNPDDAVPGDVIEIAFPEGTLHGQGYTLESGSGEEWTVEYFLAARPAYEDDVQPIWWVSGDSDVAFDSIGYVGADPMAVTVPETVATGKYRVCMRPNREVCAALTVSR